MIKKSGLLCFLCALSIVGVAQPGMKKIQEGMIGSHDYLRISYDNDVFFGTDRYYSQGAKIEYYRPTQPKQRSLFKFLNQTNKIYKAYTFCHNLFTPQDVSNSEVVTGDRPYAAYFYFGYRRLMNNQKYKFRFISEYDIGVIGPPALGKPAQSSFRKLIKKDEPFGWQNQIGTDVLASVHLKAEKILISGAQVIDFAGFAELNGGTLYDNVAGGVVLRFGRLNSYYSSLGYADIHSHEVRVKHKFNFVGFAKAKSIVVGYDATLQGGMFNDNNNYVIPNGNITRFKHQYSFGLILNYGRFDIELARETITKEFRTGKSHSWGHIGLQVAF